MAMISSNNRRQPHLTSTMAMAWTSRMDTSRAGMASRLDGSYGAVGKVSDVETLAH